MLNFFTETRYRYKSLLIAALHWSGEFIAKKREFCMYEGFPSQSYEIRVNKNFCEATERHLLRQTDLLRNSSRVYHSETALKNFLESQKLVFLNTSVRALRGETLNFH